MSVVDDGLEAIVSYVEGDMSEAEEEVFEASLFSDESLDHAADWTRLADGIRRNNSRGLRHPFCSASQAAAIRASGFAVHEVDFGDKASIPPLGPPPKCDIVITRYGMDLTGVTELELELGFDGQVVKTGRAEFKPDDDAIYGCCEYGLAAISIQMLDGHEGLLRAYSIEGGERRLLREFRMQVVGAAG